MNNDEPCAALSDNETKNVSDVTSNDKDVNEIESMPNADDGNISEVRGDE
jgi:hypothetical protein